MSYYYAKPNVRLERYELLNIPLGKDYEWSKNTLVPFVVQMLSLVQGQSTSETMEAYSIYALVNVVEIKFT